jgi:hypothetical protein
VTTANNRISKAFQTCDAVGAYRAIASAYFASLRSHFARIVLPGAEWINMVRTVEVRACIHKSRLFGDRCLMSGLIPKRP